MNVNHTAGGYDEKGIDVADVLLELSFVPRIKVWRRSSRLLPRFKAILPLTWRVRAVACVVGR